MFLTPDELHELTGKVHRSKQIEWLSSNGWPHEVRSDGRVLVLRDYLNSRMSGIDTQRPTVHATKSHNFGELTPIERIKEDWPKFRFTAEEIVSKSYPYDMSELNETECGIYFLIDDEKIVYVGQSVYVDQRLREHYESGKQFDSVFTFELDEKFLNIVESQYINTLIPELNEKLPIWREFLP